MGRAVESVTALQRLEQNRAIEELTKDQALVVPDDKTPALGELMEMVRDLQGQVKSLKSGKAEAKAPEIVTEDAPEGEMTITKFLGSHWKSQIKAIKEGKVDELLVGITQADSANKKVKEEALARFEATKESKDG